MQESVTRLLNRGTVALALAVLALVGLMAGASSRTQAQSGVQACAVTPNMLGGQGFSVSGQGFSVSGQGFSVSGQGFSVSGQGFSVSGQGLDPVVVAQEIINNPVTPGLWINDRLDFFIDGLDFNTQRTAILVIDEFNAPDAHGFQVQRVVEDSLAAVRVRVPDLQVAVFPVDISDTNTNFDADVIAEAIAAKVSELQGATPSYNHFILNMSFGLIACEAEGPVIEGQQLPAFSFEQATAVVEANNAEEPTLAVTPLLECVIKEGFSSSGIQTFGGDSGGSNNYIAYFGYMNDNAQAVTIPIGFSNKFSPHPQDRQQPTFFEPGAQHFVFSVKFDGKSSITWTLKGPDGIARTVTASKSSTPCESAPPAPSVPATPILECVADLGEGLYEAHFGYNNPNALGFKARVGQHNKFTPLPENRGQTTTFVPGLHEDVFTVEFDGSPLTWTLTGNSVTATKDSPACAEEEGFGVSQYLTLNLGVPQDMLDEYWQYLANQVSEDELQGLRQLLRDYLADSADPDLDFSAFTVAASGNLKPWVGAAPLAPASWPETVAVGALLNDGTTIWQFSQDANLVAPGAGYPTGEPNSFSAGTSFAAPAFSTLAALCATVPDALQFDGTYPPLVPPVVDSTGAKILGNLLVSTDTLGPLNCVLPEEEALEVEIDIKPGNPHNPINLQSHGKLSVAILSSDTFDAAQVDPGSVTLAGAPVILHHGQWDTKLKDVNHDGLKDLIVRVRVEDLQLTAESTEAVLEGLTFGGQAIRGVDSVTIVPPQAPRLLWPPNGWNVFSRVLFLSWTAVGEEDEADTCFLVQVDNNNDFSSPEESVVVVHWGSHTTNPLAKGTYYWRVAVSDCATETISPWSEVRSFHIKR